ncbi:MULTISPECIES: 6,7-dimethyl-8-ribityllumazine synthase [Neokomagataea]|uniref:6,7-dimethyl-8-ribityllumazine synthase n=2 Tax=Neokomagataea TaxID=1223423 RepID=A0ABQ0QG67_9PROT|nr:MULTISPECIES: 6,7-dimethyl-8-ribityllumazine synthase [Neokomagataea]MBR0558682.1 6,7-dimethyl-8-ribityllumazine synthase [Neokomagataea anthophila]GBR43567.1 6,7-dimethyl-8-ribityllumazine synthase [Neokomagataea tanensis NBRC 106556]
MSKSIPVAPDLKLTPAPRLALVVSRFNTDITGGLKNGALEWLGERDITDVDVYDAPGAFELPLLAQRLAKSGRYEGVICLGCVIKGDTAHFEFISLGATMGIMQAQLNTETPIAFGILTTYTEEQAIARSRKDAENKGREAAAACVESVAFLRNIPASA